mmetsp:Transcript_25106/g.36856  ORF Transcript_25106/g.36856 Transcript_25106/m.36856 type:complete len:215 (+) Transcript_25106:87-731(+)
MRHLQHISLSLLFIVFIFLHLSVISASSLSSAAFIVNKGTEVVAKTTIMAIASTETGGKERKEGVLLEAFTASQQAEKIKSCFAIRKSVFIEEQSVPVEIEMDSLDDTATHILATDKQTGSPCGAARLVVLDGTDIGKIGRVCVLSTKRGQGIGRKIVLFAVEQLKGPLRCSKAKLGAQVHALSFYESMGFKLIPGEEYMAAGGVPHRDMEIIF